MSGPGPLGANLLGYKLPLRALLSPQISFPHSPGDSLVIALLIICLLTRGELSEGRELSYSLCVSAVGYSAYHGVRTQPLVE